MEESHILCFLILSDLILYYNTTTRLMFTSPSPPPRFPRGDGYIQLLGESGHGIVTYTLLPGLI
jgi:hypothetical protein